MNRTVSRFETKSIDREARTFEGYVSTWDVDLGGDVIRPGAFKRTLDHWQQSGRAIPLIDSHDAFSTVLSAVGKLVQGEEDRKGLYTKWEIVEDDHADRYLKRIEAGVVDRMSIGYNVVRESAPNEAEEAKGARRALDEIALKEGSLVLFPMNENAAIDTTSVKALLQIAQDRDLTDAEVAQLAELRDHITKALTKPEPVYEDTAGLMTRLQTVRLASMLREIRHPH